MLACVPASATGKPHQLFQPPGAQEKAMSTVAMSRMTSM